MKNFLFLIIVIFISLACNRKISPIEIKKNGNLQKRIMELVLDDFIMKFYKNLSSDQVPIFISSSLKYFYHLEDNYRYKGIKITDAMFISDECADCQILNFKEVYKFDGVQELNLKSKFSSKEYNKNQTNYPYYFEFSPVVPFKEGKKKFFIQLHSIEAKQHCIHNYILEEIGLNEYIVIKSIIKNC